MECTIPVCQSTFSTPAFSVSYMCNVVAESWPFLHKMRLSTTTACLYTWYIPAIPGSRHTLFGSGMVSVLPSAELWLAKTAVVSAGGTGTVTDVRVGMGRVWVRVAGMVGMLGEPLDASFSTILSADLTAVGLRRLRIQFWVEETQIPQLEHL